MTAYYNEIDPYAAQWLRNLIHDRQISPGEVDTRSIVDVKPADLLGFTQCHFFAGIGGWSLALRLAGWSDDRPVWTGSCPCQPFSTAGKAVGFADHRHLWPAWFRLISKCRPSIVFGEQVSNAGLWLDGVYADLEGEGFAVGAADLPAVAVDAKHKRHRLWFVAYAADKLRRADPRGLGAGESESGRQTQGGIVQEGLRVSGNDGLATRSPPLADANSQSPIGTSVARLERDTWSPEPAVGRVVDGIPHSLVEPLLHGFGNAIVPKVAAEFIAAADAALTPRMLRSD